MAGNEFLRFAYAGGETRYSISRISFIEAVKWPRFILSTKRKFRRNLWELTKRFVPLFFIINGKTGARALAQKGEETLEG